MITHVSISHFRPYKEIHSRMTISRNYDDSQLLLRQCEIHNELCFSCCGS